METETARTPPSGESTGLRGLAQAGLSYFEARSRLFQIEAAEAGHHLTRLVVLAVMAAGLVGAAWLLLMPVAVWCIAHYSGFSWQSVAGTLGAAHLLIGLFLVLRLKMAASRLKLFEETINQCRKDRECLGGSTHEGI